MGYLRKHLQQVRLLSTLLFVGVLGGLLAPLPSEALPPTVTLKIDNGTAVSIRSTTNTSSTCTSTEQTLGYTHCYAINTNLTVAGAGAAGGVQRSYLVRNAPGATARLRVADTAGQNKLSLIGVQFVPAPLAGQTVANWGNVSPTFANTNEIHKLTITTFNVYNSPVNTGNAGTQAIALRAGGEFRAGPTASGACAGSITTGLCNNVGNSVTFPGTGTFSPSGLVNILRPSGANSQPLSLTVGGPTAAIVSFNGLTNTTLGQVNPTYPSFLCDSNGATVGGVCTPSITQIMTVTLKGPDSFVLVNGGDTFCADCAATLSAKEQKKIAFLTKLVGFLNWLEQRHPNPRLSAFIDQIEAFLAVVNSNPNNEGYDMPCPGATLVNLDIATAAAADQVAFMADGAVDVEPAPPAPETGTITIIKRTSPATRDLTFGFIGTGNGITNFDILTNEDLCNDGCWGGRKDFSGLLTGEAGGSRTITETAQTPGWRTSSVVCSSLDEGTTFYTGALGNYVNVTNLADGDTLTCTFNNSPVAAATGTIDISKRLDTCSSECTPAAFHFTITNVDTQEVTSFQVRTGSNGTGSAGIPVIAGPYSVVEDGSDNGMSLHSTSGPCANDSGTFTVGAGETVSCTFTNGFDL